MKIISGHQPVYLPWLGLMHKAALADRFVVMDDVQYLTQDWNNRNKIRTPDGWQWLTVPVNLKESASQRIKDIRVANSGWDSRRHWQLQHWKAIRTNYSRSAYWNDHASWLEEFYTKQPWNWLHELNLVLLSYLLEKFGIAPELVIASEFGFHGRKSDLVLDHARKLGGKIVVTGALGRNYINVTDFLNAGIFLQFQDYRHPEYAQRWPGFEPNMCAFDLLLNHGPASPEILMRGNVQADDLRAAVKAADTPRVLEVSP